MLVCRKTTIHLLPADEREEDGEHVGYKLPDFGVQPEAQTQVKPDASLTFNSDFHPEYTERKVIRYIQLKYVLILSVCS